MKIGLPVDKLPVGHPARKAAIDRHVKNVTSPSPARQKRGAQGLGRMNLSPAEKQYVHVETQKKGGAYAHGPVFAPAPKHPPGPRFGNVGAGGPSRAYTSDRTSPDPYSQALALESQKPPKQSKIESLLEGPALRSLNAVEKANQINDLYRQQAIQGGDPTIGQPGLLPAIGKNLYHSLGLEMVAHSFRHPLGYTIGSPQYEADLGRANKSARNAIENTTGYKEIEHIRSHPLAGSLALASLLPFGRFAKFAELAKASRATEVGLRAAEEERLAAKAVKAERLSAKGGIVATKRAARMSRQLAQRGAARTPEEVASHIAEQAAISKSMGKGLPIPKLEPGQITDRTGGELGAKFRAAMKELPAIRAAQEDARLPERAKVFGRLNAAQQKALKSDKPFENLVAANTTRAGKLSAGEFHGFDSLTPEELNQAALHMAHNTGLVGHSLENAQLAIKAAIRDGKPLAKHEQAYLEHAFGREVNTKELDASRTKWQKALDVFGIPRALESSGDMSGSFRQTIGALAYNPKVWSEGIGPSFKSLFKEGNYQGLEEAVQSDSYYPLAQRGALKLPDLGQHAGEVDFATQSEAKFVSNAAEKLNLRELPIPGIKGKKWATGPGDLVRATDRSYAALLTVIRMHLFKTLLDQAVANGWNIDDHLLKSIGDLSNVLTGSGNLLPGHGVTMNALFFSPKLLYSRLNMLGFGGGGVGAAIPGSWYYRLHPFARVQAMRATGQLLGTLGLVLSTARLLGATVNHDPRNADFGKIRLGNTRIDIGAGLQQPIRLMAQLATGEVVSSTTGRLEHLSGGYAGRSRLDAFMQFLEGKAAPIPSIAIDLAKGHQFNGQPLDWSLNPLDTNSEITSHLTPLAAQDAISTGQQTHSTLAGLGGGLLSATGVGVGSYSAIPSNSPQKIKAAVQKELVGTPSSPGLLKQLKALKVPDSYRPLYTKAVRTQVQRDLAKAEARKVSPTGKITEAESYKITMQTLLKNGMVTPATYKQAVAAIGGMSDREIRHWEYEAWTHSSANGDGWGPGQLLEKIHSAYNIKTGR